MKTIQQDLKSNNHSLNEATDMAHNGPLSRLSDVYIWRYVLLMVHATKEEEEEDSMIPYITLQ